ncbi:C39 family peptidase [Roseburia sp. AF42-8]|uniref:C39 family peptidase n=1 Tax=Roseburia sp. AF42-8 TaxID=2293137 RepID=UPI001314A1FA|nr:C39 family peptidase [Roseburia sp. AF42-8]
MLKRIEVLQYGSVETTAQTEEKTDFVGSIDIIDVEKPVQRTWTETLQRLDELGQINPVIEEISKNNSLYPESMLTALANNPEMADFVSGYLDENGRTVEGLTYLEREQEYPLFLQWDTRWGYLPYGDDSIIGLSGCGPTCMSMILYYLTDDEALTPDKLAAYAMSNNYYAEGIGTAWVFMEDVPLLYGIKVSEPRVTERAIKAELDKGAVIICAMGEGDFTVSGHFIVIYGYDETGFKVNDPNCVARSRKRWAFNEIEQQIKKIWTYER